MHDLVYRFQFGDGSIKSFPIKPETDASKADLPAWTELGFHQCPNCPLASDTTPHCPMAVNLLPLIAAFGDRQSYDPVTAQAESAERTVTKATTVQKAIGSLMGLLTVTSDCPHVGFLKPMAHFHLPFSTEEETIYRVASMYLLAQYFARQREQQPDWDLKQLKAHYEELQRVNHAMAGRLRAVSEKDGALNALTLLDLFAKALPYSIDDSLEDVRAIFEAVDSSR